MNLDKYMDKLRVLEEKEKKNKMPKYVIAAKGPLVEEDDGEPLFWSNQLGWASLTNATIFTKKEKNKLELPLFAWGWVLLPRR